MHGTSWQVVELVLQLLQLGLWMQTDQWLARNAAPLVGSCFMHEASCYEDQQYNSPWRQLHAGPCCSLSEAPGCEASGWVLLARLAARCTAYGYAVRRGLDWSRTPRLPHDTPSLS